MKACRVFERLQAAERLVTRERRERKLESVPKVFKTKGLSGKRIVSERTGQVVVVRRRKGIVDQKPEPAVIEQTQVLEHRLPEPRQTTMAPEGYLSSPVRFIVPNFKWGRSSRTRGQLLRALFGAQVNQPSLYMSARVYHPRRSY